MKNLTIINLILFTACFVMFLTEKNYPAASGWFCACLLQCRHILEHNND